MNDNIKWMDLSEHYDDPNLVGDIRFTNDDYSGQTAKVWAEGESFWVTLVSKTDDNEYIAEVDNLLLGYDVMPGDTIKVPASAIMGVFDEDAPRYFS